MLQTKTIPEDDRVYESRTAQLKQVFALSVPGLLNVLSICIQGVGLQYITATVSLMLSGSCIVFTAALSVVLLRCRLNLYHFSGQFPTSPHCPRCLSNSYVRMSVSSKPIIQVY